MNNSAKSGPVINFQCGTVEEEFSSGGHAGQLVKTLNRTTDSIKQLVASKSYKISPSQAGPIPREDSFVFLVELCELFIPFRKQAQEEQIGNLLDGVHGVVDATGVKDIHELIDFLAQTR